MLTNIAKARVLLVCAALAVQAGLAQSASAAAFYFLFDHTFSGANSRGTAPWSEVLFQDTAPGVVTLTISNPGLAGDEYVSQLFLNLNPHLNPAHLSVTLTDASDGVGTPCVWLGANQFKAGADGKYDFLLNMSTSLGHTFGAGDHLTYQIAGISTLTASDFNYFDVPTSGSVPHLAAAHIESIRACYTEGWVNPSQVTPVGVPEPGTGALLIAGAGLAWFLRKRSVCS